MIGAGAGVPAELAEQILEVLAAFDERLAALEQASPLRARDAAAWRGDGGAARGSACDFNMLSFALLAPGERKLSMREDYARRTGLFRPLEMRLSRFLARWRLGEAFAPMERGAGPGRGKKDVSAETSFRGLLDRSGVDKKFVLLKFSGSPKEPQASSPRARADS